MRIVVIGGTGHIGTYLSPMLAEAGHDVISVSRSQRQPYQPHLAWSRIAHCSLDRPLEEARGEFAQKIAALSADAVIDLTCYTLESARHLLEGLRGSVRHFLHCGTIWVHGHSVQVPTAEDSPREPFGDYGLRKAAIENYLLATDLPVTILHPGHLVGPGWFPINPAGNFNPEVFANLASGREVQLPNLGMETLHHVHAADVAAAFVQAIGAGEAAWRQSFHVVSSAALTLRGYAERVASWFGRKAVLRFLPYEEWRAHVSEKDAQITLDHIARSSNCSIEKARRLIGYEPKYSSLEAVRESLDWLIQEGKVRVSSLSEPGVLPK